MASLAENPSEHQLLLHMEVQYLNERQNDLLVECLFTAKSIQRISDLLGELDLQPTKVLPISSGRFDHANWFLRTCSKEADFICGFDISSWFYVWQVKDSGTALLLLFAEGGTHGEPLAILQYYYPQKLFFNIAAYRRWQRLNDVVDASSHQLKRLGDVTIYLDKYEMWPGERVNVIRLESCHLPAFCERHAGDQIS